jgi:hypothetical protein
MPAFIVEATDMDRWHRGRGVSAARPPHALIVRVPRAGM